MILWTIQPEEVFNQIMEIGVYRCDFSKSFMNYWKYQYDWLVKQMKIRLGNPPKGVTYPVWAWYKLEGKRKKLDLRRERWANGENGEKFVCLEIDIPDNQVLLSDFDLWSIILCNGLISNSEEESDMLDTKFDKLSNSNKLIFKDRNWQEVFNIQSFKNDWITRGDSIQATFWELKKSQIKDIRHFKSAYKRA